MRPISARTTLCLCLLLLPVASAAASDTLTLTDNAYERASALLTIRDAYADNTAMHHLLYRSSLSSFGARYEWRHETETLLDEMGRGEGITHLHADTYLRPSPGEHLWGYADYANGKKKGVERNSTSDYLRLYPYIIAGEEGGDLSHERYTFGGGYSHLIGEALRGAAEISYRSQQEYRTVDPRPRNVVSDLHLSVGLSYPVAMYTLGLSAEYGIYKQRSSVALYHPMGGVMQRLMNGLGGSFRRFDANEPFVNYGGQSLAIALHLLPQSLRSGWMCEAGYRYSDLEQTVSDHNDVPIHHYRDHRIELSAARMQRIGSLVWSIDLRGTIAYRNGVEHIVGEPSAGTYPVVGYNPNFHRSLAHGRLTLSVGDDEHQREGWHWRVSPGLDYNFLKISVLEPEKELSRRRWLGLLRGEVAYLPRRHGYVTLALEASYAPQASGQLLLPRAEMDPLLVARLDHTYRTLASSTMGFLIAPKYHLPLGRWAGSSAVELSCRYRLDRYRYAEASAVYRHALVAEIRLVL